MINRKATKSKCCAKTRKGAPCQRTALANGRCRNHGGLSTGPKTIAGQIRAIANLRQNRKTNVPI